MAHRFQIGGQIALLDLQQAVERFAVAGVDFHPREPAALPRLGGFGRQFEERIVGPRLRRHVQFTGLRDERHRVGVEVVPDVRDQRLDPPVAEQVDEPHRVRTDIGEATPANVEANEPAAERVLQSVRHRADLLAQLRVEWVEEFREFLVPLRARLQPRLLALVADERGAVGLVVLVEIVREHQPVQVVLRVRERGPHQRLEVDGRRFGRLDFDTQFRVFEQVEQQRQRVLARDLGTRAVAPPLEPGAGALDGHLVRVGEAAAHDPPAAPVGGRLDGAEPALRQHFPRGRN